MASFSPFWQSLESLSAPRKLRIGFSDSSDTRVLQAVSLLTKFPIEPILFGDKNEIEKVAKEAGVPLEKVTITATKENAEGTKKILLSKVQNPEKTTDIETIVNDPLYQGVASLIAGKIDGFVSGSTKPTAEVVKAAIRYIGPKTGHRLITGQFFIESETLKTNDDTPFLFADCAVTPEPSPRFLAQIAYDAAQSFIFHTKKQPKIAFLSFSTKGSADHALVERIKEALNIFSKAHPEIVVDGELQVDAAVDTGVARRKGAGASPVAGYSNILIFPNLESGNIGYKLIQRFGKTRVAGPLLWGLAFPMSDLSRGCNVQEIVDTALCIAEQARSNL